MILNGNNQKREHSCAKENFIEHETTENKTNSVWLTTDLPVHLVKLVKARISHLNDERELRLGFLAPLLPLGTVLSVKFLWQTKSDQGMGLSTGTPSSAVFTFELALAWVWPGQLILFQIVPKAQFWGQHMLRRFSSKNLGCNYPVSVREGGGMYGSVEESWLNLLDSGPEEAATGSGDGLLHNSHCQSLLLQRVTHHFFIFYFFKVYLRWQLSFV